MGIKNDQRQPVEKWLSAIDLSGGHTLNGVQFPLKDVLRRSLYYPASGFDGRPVQFLGGLVHSFIYVDFGPQGADLDRELQQDGFQGYRVAGRKALQERDLAPGGWRRRVPPQFQEEAQREFDKYRDRGFLSPFAAWLIFDRLPKYGCEHGPERFSLVYICADAVAAYQALYIENHVAPLILTLIQPEGGVCGLANPNGFFAHTVLRMNGDNIPEYMACGWDRAECYQAFWPAAYPFNVEYFQHQGGNGLWSRHPPPAA